MKCRICDKEIEKPFFSLGNMPLSNSLVIDPLSIEKYYPLNIYLCDKCYFLQTPEFELAKNIFSENYPYFSSYSETWLKHCKNYVDMIVDKYLIYKENPFVIEIGSNDGTLLQYFKNHNFNRRDEIRVLGIEPVKAAADIATEKGIPTDIKYFDIDYVVDNDINAAADLIIGNNVLAHNPNLDSFVSGMKRILKDDGIITIEVPWLLNLIEKNEFDTIYHEHYSYFSLFSLRKLFLKHELKVFDVKEIPTHGGSIRIYIKHRDNLDIKEKIENISDLIKKETELYNIKTYIDFVNRVNMIKRDLLKILIDIKESNGKIIGYGAPAKGNTLLNYCSIGTDFIDYTVDMNPIKQGKFLPGSHIPIYSPDKIKEDRPDYILILPWNLKEELIKQLEYTKKWGCKFIIPIPMPYIMIT